MRARLGMGGGMYLIGGLLTLALAFPPVPAGATTHPPRGLATRAPGRDLGPTKAGRVNFLVSLHGDHQPECLRHRLEGAGLSLQWSSGQKWASVGGPVPAVERVFNVSIHDFATSSGRVAFAATTPATIPSGTCGEVQGVGSIQSYAAPMTEDVPANGLTAPELVNAYDVGPLHSAGMNGEGQTVVFFEADGFSARDLATFAHSQHLPPFNIQVVGQNSGKGDETPMDLETVHELAPAAKLVYLNLASSKAARNGTVSDVFASALALSTKDWPGAAISISLGYCETGGYFDQSDVEGLNSAVATAEATGSTVFASSGDSGGLDCTPPNDGGKPPRASFEGVVVPAVLPNVTGVGGTSLSTTASGAWVGETTWSEPLLSQGAGGGVSQAFERPTWQTGLGTGGSFDKNNGREVPDVAADADPATGNLIVIKGGTTLGGGTSLATPIWAAGTVLIDQYLGTKQGKSVGFFNPVLYGLANGHPTYAPFHDITAGGNDFYPATPGYDMVTGLGSPDFWHIAQDLAAGGQ